MKLDPLGKMLEFSVLIYKANGPRKYGVSPSNMWRRGAFAFQAIVSGRCEMTTESGRIPVASPALFLSAPDFIHGWSGKGDESCRVVIFHFLTIHPLLVRALGVEPWLSVPLGKGDRIFLEKLFRSAEESSARSPWYLQLEIDLIKGRLMSFFAEKLPRPGGQVTAAHPEIVVQKAALIYVKALPKVLSIREIARQLDYSVSHLRALFQTALAESPLVHFNRLRMDRARLLLRDRELSVSEVGDRLGFEDPGRFSRAFKKEFGVSPRDWRADPERGD